MEKWMEVRMDDDMTNYRLQLNLKFSLQSIMFCENNGQFQFCIDSDIDGSVASAHRAVLKGGLTQQSETFSIVRG